MSPAKKNELRTLIHKKLNLLTFQELVVKTANLRQFFEKNIYSPYPPSLKQKFIVSFYPFDTEPQINLESYDLKLGYVRVTDWAGMKMHACEARRDTPGQWEEFEPQPDVQIYQPLATQPVLNANQIAAILVPGLAFDREGNRLGRGKGFYDRFLKTIPHALRIGLAFQEQIIDPGAANSIEVQSWDQPVDVILTDQQWISTPRFSSWAKHGIIER